VVPISRLTFDPESLLRSLMTNVPGAVYRCEVDDDWTMLGIGDDIERITGYPAEEFIASAGRSFSSIVHPDDLHRVHDECRRAVDADRPFALEYRVARADGGWRWVLDRGVKTVDRDGHPWLDGVIFDITERRAAEETLRARDAEAARIAELQASRVRIIAAADDARRRLARDLHDGAQQRLLSAQLRLTLLERRLRADDAAMDLLREARAELDGGLADLRELARGIHPSVLTDHGLSAAVRALADRCALPVDLHDDLGQRLDPAIEAALYFTIAEALTNVLRYARASSATVSLRCRDGWAVAEIADDGCGGADQRRGSGLRGLADRLSALRGRLEVESPQGGGTTLRARVPLTSSPAAPTRRNPRERHP
jgi:PAS domain S-box-containing protein